MTFRKFKWSLEECKNEALKYENKTDWSNNSSGSFSAAYNNGWINECSKHMIGLQKLKGYS